MSRLDTIVERLRLVPCTDEMWQAENVERAIRQLRVIADTKLCQYHERLNAEVEIVSAERPKVHVA